MSTAFQGSYTASLYDARKRYRMYTQKGTPLADAELREIQDVSDSFVRQLVHENFPRGSSINNGFQVVQSGSPSNNFTIKGGDGTTNGAGVLFVDGYILFLKSDIEYNAQNATGALTDDAYTKTTIPGLSTPGGARTDEVYVDFYFAEVSATVGSEYTDASLVVAGIGSTTANRVRQVQDIRVAEGGVTPSDGNDGNGIYHRYVKIATLARTATANINTAMITDNRVKINSVQSMSLGTTVTDLLLTNGANIGNASHRIGTIFMASNIDHSNNLTFNTNKVTVTTGGLVGIGTTPATELEIAKTTGSPTIKLRALDGTSSVVLDTANSPASPLPGLTFKVNGVSGLALDNLGNVGVGSALVVANNLTVNGTTSTVNTEVTVADKLEIDQTQAQEALIINKSNVGAGTAILITNSGTGNSLQVNTNKFVITSAGLVGIGTTNPNASLHILNTTNNVFSANLKTTATTGQSYGMQMLAGSNSADSALIIYDQSAVNQMFTVRGDGHVGVGTAPVNTFSVFANDTVNAAARIKNNAATGSNFGLQLFAGTNASDYALLVADPTNTTTKMIITGSGSVGIGTANPQSTLDVWTTGVVSTMKVIGGMVGIGVEAAAPYYMLQIGQNIWSNLGSNYKLAVANGDIVCGGPGATTAIVRLASSDGGGLFIKHYTGNNSEIFDGNAVIHLTSGNANVGIGTDSPSAGLDVARQVGFSAAIARFVTIDGSLGTVYVGEYGKKVQLHVTDEIVLHNTSWSGNRTTTGIIFKMDQGGAEAWRISTDGATNNDTKSLTFVGNSSGISELTVNVNYGVAVNALTGSGNRLVYSNPTGQLTNSSSDINLKKNIVTITGNLAKTLQLRPVSFNWKDEENRGAQKEIGLIAQEVQKIVPEVIGSNKDKTLSLDYPKLVAILIGAIQELNARIEKLETK